MAQLKRIRQLLSRHEFAALFRELGWDLYRGHFSIKIDGECFVLNSVAQKRGVVVLIHNAKPGCIPVRATRVAIERKIRQLVHEHIIIFEDESKDRQIWQWVRRAIGKPAAVREYPAEKNLERLSQMLIRLAVELSEEEDLLQPHVSARVAQAFDTDRVTRKFYDRFKAEHEKFLSFVEGIDAVHHREWYSSLMFNRLMFVYFIQRKGLLDGNPNYLRSRLEAVQAQRPSRGSITFYRYFLIRLFHEGLGARVRKDRAFEALLGKVPFLNGGLFELHELERQYPAIDIPDEAFVSVFDFFDSYAWHLDDRPSRSDNEINPDVIGYIFEKYINQREMGAYYTKDDVTSYIAARTIIPALLDKLAACCPDVWGPRGKVWRLVAEDPEAYLPSSLLKGIGSKKQAPIGATADYCLPGETDRERDERVEYVAKTCARLREGVSSADELITLGVDLLQFIVDALSAMDDPDELMVAYDILAAVTILDPACGSGAFLFAAVGILQPLHSACLERMGEWVEEAGANRHRARFLAIIQASAAHPTREYFILKTIVLGCLYGVDIMEEAVEICKLRFFLKFAAQLEPGSDLEPLPDLDFNIRAGNSLVGLASYQEVSSSSKNSRQGLLDLNSELPRLRETAARADAAYREFRQLQSLRKHAPANDNHIARAKQTIRDELSSVRCELDQHVAKEQAQKPVSMKALSEWRSTHKPFHWPVEYYSALQDGGFDIIIGNPPYVEIKNVDYKITRLQTVACGDLYACFVERSCNLLKPNGRLGLIISISAFGVDGFASLQKFVFTHTSMIWLSFFSNRPAQLFNGAQKRLTIMLAQKSTNATGRPVLYSSSYLRWRGEEREHLFASRLRYHRLARARQVFDSAVEKLGSQIEQDIFDKMIRKPRLDRSESSATTAFPVFYTRKFGYFLLFLDRPPKVVDLKSGVERLPSELKSIHLPSQAQARATIASLSSTSFFWFWNVLSDCRNLNRRDILAYPVSPDFLPKDVQSSLAKLGEKYIRKLNSTSSFMNKGTLKLETFAYAECKPMLDEVDRVLAKYFRVDRSRA